MSEFSSSPPIDRSALFGAAASPVQPSNTTQDKSGTEKEERGHPKAGAAMDATPKARLTHDPALNLAPSVASIRPGQLVVGRVTGIDAEGRPILKTTEGEFALDPSAGLKPGDDVRIRIAEVGHDLLGDVEARRGQKIDPPIRVEMIMTSVHLRTDRTALSDPAPAAESYRPDHPPVRNQPQEDAAVIAREIGARQAQSRRLEPETRQDTASPPKHDLPLVTLDDFEVAALSRQRTFRSEGIQSETTAGTTRNQEFSNIPGRVVHEFDKLERLPESPAPLPSVGTRVQVTVRTETTSPPAGLPILEATVVTPEEAIRNPSLALAEPTGAAAVTALPVTDSSGRQYLRTAEGVITFRPETPFPLGSRLQILVDPITETPAATTAALETTALPVGTVLTGQPIAQISSPAGIAPPSPGPAPMTTFVVTESAGVTSSTGEIATPLTPAEARSLAAQIAFDMPEGSKSPLLLRMGDAFYAANRLVHPAPTHPVSPTTAPAGTEVTARAPASASSLFIPPAGTTLFIETVHVAGSGDDRIPPTGAAQHYVVVPQNAVSAGNSPVLPAITVTREELAAANPAARATSGSGAPVTILRIGRSFLIARDLPPMDPGTALNLVATGGSSRVASAPGQGTVQPSQAPPAIAVGTTLSLRTLASVAGGRPTPFALPDNGRSALYTVAPPNTGSEETSVPAFVLSTGQARSLAPGLVPRTLAAADTPLFLRIGDTVLAGPPLAARQLPPGTRLQLSPAPAKEAAGSGDVTAAPTSIVGPSTNAAIMAPELADQAVAATSTIPGAQAFLPLPLGAPPPLFTYTEHWPALVALGQAVAASSAAVRNEFSARIVKPDGRFTNTLSFFMAALGRGDARGWVGDETARALAAFGRTDILDMLEEDMRRVAGSRVEIAGADWRPLLLPIQTNDGLQALAFLFRHWEQETPDGRKGTGPEDGQSDGRRFLLQFELTRMGPMQLEGMIRKRRFDLIIRTNGTLDQTMKQEIRQLFATALESSGYTGSIAFEENQPFALDIPDALKNAVEPMVRQA